MRTRDQTRMDNQRDERDERTVDLRTVTPDPAAIALLDERTARELAAVPLSIVDDRVVVAVADPSVVERVRAAIGSAYRVTPVAAVRADILATIGNSYRALTGIDNQVARSRHATHCAGARHGPRRRRRRARTPRSCMSSR